MPYEYERSAHGSLETSIDFNLNPLLCNLKNPSFAHLRGWLMRQIQDVALVFTASTAVLINSIWASAQRIHQPPIAEHQLPERSTRSKLHILKGIKEWVSNPLIWIQQLRALFPPISRQKTLTYKHRQRRKNCQLGRVWYQPNKEVHVDYTNAQLIWRKANPAQSF